MRLAVITNIIAPYRIPLFEELAKRCDLLVLTLADRHVGRDWTPQAMGFETHTLPGLRLSRTKSVDPIHLNVGTWAALRRFRPDAVLAGGFTPAHLEALAYCRGNRRAYLCWGELFLRHESEALFARRWVRHAIVRASDGWIASSSDSRDAFVHYGAQRDRVLVSLMPVRSARFRAAALEATSSGLAGEIRKRCGGPVILGVGRLVSQKGWPQLLHALPLIRREIPDCALVIAGDGPELTSFESLVGSLNLDRVFFVGSRDADELSALYAAADVFAFPTLCDPFGAVLVEAVACGTFSVSSIHAGATRDVITDGVSGLTVDPADPVTLAETLCRALRLPAAERAAMAERARERLPGDDIVAGAEDIVRYSTAVALRRGAWSPARAAQDP